jgi:hypothetical protein
LYCDPFYSELLDNVSARYGDEFVQLGNGNILTQCRDALVLLSRRNREVDQHSLNGHFLEFSLLREGTFKDYSSLRAYQPRRFWSQLSSRWPLLALVLGWVYLGPGSSAGVERQHKTGKRVHSAIRNCTGSGKVERLVAIAYNTASSRRVLPDTRQPFEKVIAALCKPEAVVDERLLDNELEQATRRLVDS